MRYFGHYWAIEPLFQSSTVCWSAKHDRVVPLTVWNDPLNTRNENLSFCIQRKNCFNSSFLRELTAWSCYTNAQKFLLFFVIFKFRNKRIFCLQEILRIVMLITSVNALPWRSGGARRPRVVINNSSLSTEIDSQCIALGNRYLQPTQSSFLLLNSLIIAVLLGLGYLWNQRNPYLSKTSDQSFLGSTP